MRTNDFGSFAAEFILPTSCLNGDFVIKAGNLATTTVRVEEYKRPTFEITFDPVKTAYALGDTVTLTGRVTAYNGAAIQEVPLAYTLTRGYGIWRGETRPLVADTVRLDAEGRFSIPVALLPEGKENNFSPVAYFTLAVSVTGSNGETQSETRTFSASKRGHVSSLSCSRGKAVQATGFARFLRFGRTDDVGCLEVLAFGNLSAGTNRPRTRRAGG